MTSREKYREINAALVDSVPELRLRYEEETAAWGEEMGPHVIYADLLNPYLAELLDAPEQAGAGADEAALRRVFGFLETLLAHPDPEFADVVRTAVAVDLESNEGRLERARIYMGPLMAEETRRRIPYRRPKRMSRE